MFPILVKFGPLTIRTYGFMVAIGLYAAMQYVLNKAKKNNIVEGHMMDLMFYTIIAGLLGARILYVLGNWQYYTNHLGEILKIWEGGLVYYGGFIAGSLSVITFVFFHPSIKLLVLADIFAPTLALGHFFGRLGCFFAGCCYGKESNLLWAVKFSNHECLAPLNKNLHPTQIYEAIANLIMFFVLNWYDKIKRKEGDTFILYLLCYGFLRFIIEFFRGDERGAFLFNLSQGQIISIMAVITGMVLIYGKKHNVNS